MSDYYRNVNLDLLNRIPEQATSVLEIGCGSGWLGAAFKAKNPSCQYFEIEIIE
jgi:tRNA G46 methylase TrmB